MKRISLNDNALIMMTIIMMMVKHGDRHYQLQLQFNRLSKQLLLLSISPQIIIKRLFKTVQSFFSQFRWQMISFINNSVKNSFLTICESFPS